MDIKQIALPLSQVVPHPNIALQVQNCGLKHQCPFPLLYRFAEKTNQEWQEVMEGCKFPYGPINNMEGAFSDPQVRGNKTDRCCCNDSKIYHTIRRFVFM